jgi:hypothetical protein
MIPFAARTHRATDPVPLTQHIEAGHPGAAPVGASQRGEYADRCGFASPVLAEKGEDRPGPLGPDRILDGIAQLI